MYRTWSCRSLVAKSSKSIESWLEASECTERLEASSLCRCAQRLRPINLPELAGTFFDTDNCQGSVKFRDEAEGWEDSLRAIVGCTVE